MFKLDTIKFDKLLRNTYLNGIIKQCVINIKNGIGNISTIDELNSLTMSHSLVISEDSKEEYTLGINDLSILCKLITDLAKQNVTPSYSLDKTNTWFCVNNPSKGKAKLLLVSPDTVPTNICGSEIRIKMKKDYVNSIKITKEQIENLLYYVNLFQSKVLVFAVQNTHCLIKSSEFENNQFRVNLDDCGSANENLELEVGTKNLISILNQIKNDEEEIIISFKKDFPLIIEQGSFFWALAPILRITSNND